MIVISGYICLVAWLFAVIGYSLHWYLHGELNIPVSGTIMIITICLLVSGSAGFQSNIKTTIIIIICSYMYIVIYTLQYCYFGNYNYMLKIIL